MSANPRCWSDVNYEFAGIVRELDALQYARQEILDRLPIGLPTRTAPPAPDSRQYSVNLVEEGRSSIIAGLEMC